MSNETIFGKVFLGGSKRIGRVPEKVAAYLDSFIESREHFLIGDCHGADLALQLRLFRMRCAFSWHQAEPHGSQTPR